MTETTARKITPGMVIGIIGLGIGMLVFAGAMMIGITIDPRVDLHGRLVAYTASLAGLAAAMGFRSSLAVGPVERGVFAALAVVTAIGAIAYGLVML